MPDPALTEVNHHRCCHDENGRKRGLLSRFRASAGNCCHTHPNGSLAHRIEAVEATQEQTQEQLDSIEARLRVLLPEEERELSGL